MRLKSQRFSENEVDRKEAAKAEDFETAKNLKKEEESLQVAKIINVEKCRKIQKNAEKRRKIALSAKSQCFLQNHSEIVVFFAFSEASRNRQRRGKTEGERGALSYYNAFLNPYTSKHFFQNFVGVR